MDALTPLLYALLAVAALAVVFFVYRRYGWAPAAAVGAFFVGLLGLIPAARRLLQPAPERPRPVGPRPLEVESAAREAEAHKAADEKHEAASETLDRFKHIEGRDEKTKAISKWQDERRKRGGHFTPPGWLVGLLVVLAIALLLSAGCAAKTPPPIFSLALPALPESLLVEPPPPVLAEDGCGVVPLLPGSPLPPELLGPALRGAPTAACRGIVVDEAELLAAGQCEADRTRLQAYFTAERAGRLSDRRTCEGVYGAEWLYGQALRVDNRVKSWTGIGLAVLASVVFAGLGYAAGSLP